MVGDIAHLDFQVELKCEERLCHDAGKPNQASYMLNARCPHCGCTGHEVLCVRCWLWLILQPDFDCAECGGDLGRVENWARLVVIDDKR